MNPDTFDLPIQQKIVGLMIKDRNFLLKCADYIKPHYFDSEALMDISRITLEYFKKYRNTPSNLALLQMVDELLTTSKRINPDIYFNTIDEIFKDSIPEREYINDKVIEFVLFQEIRNVLVNSIDLLQNKEFEKIKHNLDKVFKIKSDQLPGLDFFDPEQIIQRHSIEESDKIPTGFPELDKALGGGLGLGELGIIMAAANVGKSILLTLFGANGLRNRKRVLHFTLEMKDSKVAIRYDRNILGKTRSSIKENLDESAKFLLQFAKNLRNNLHIKQWPTRIASINTMRAYIEQEKYEGREYDLILVDYAAIMKASVTRDSRHLEIEECVEDLRGLAGELNVPIWTAAQTKAVGVNKPILSLEDLGEAFAQAKVADVVVAACQTKKEYEDDELRLMLAKNRDDKKFITLKYKTMFDIMRMRYEP